MTAVQGKGHNNKLAEDADRPARQKSQSPALQFSSCAELV